MIQAQRKWRLVLSNFLIVESHYRSRPWFLAADRLGIEISGVFHMQEELNFVKQNCHNVTSYFIHSINGELKPSCKSLGILSKEERSFVINADRRLIDLPKSEANAYINRLEDWWENFLSNSDLSFVFSELSWAHEIVGCLIAKKKYINWFSVCESKILERHVFIFSDFSRKNLVYNKKIDTYLLKKSLRKLQKKKSQTENFEILNKKHLLTFDQLKWFLDSVRLDLFGFKNPIVQYPAYKVLNRKFFHFFQYHSVKKFFSNIEINRQSIVLCLHVQPESSVDVACFNYRNQVEVCLKLNEIISKDYDLIVKPHPHGRSQWSPSFYNKLIMSKIKICNPSINISTLAKNDNVVAIGSIGGFAPVESQINNCVGFHIEESAFSSLLEGGAIGLSDIGFSKLKKVIDENQQKNGNDRFKQNLSILLSYAFPGSSHPLNRNKWVMEEDNISKWSSIFKVLLKNSNENAKHL